MRITSLALTDLRRYRDARVRACRPASTIVRGPNEAGKSTIQRAIELALTRKVTSSAARPRRAGARGTATRTSRTTVALTFTLRGRGGRRRARAGSRSRSAAPRARSASSSTATPITDPARADEELASSSRASRPRASSARRPRSATTSWPGSSATRARCATGSRRRSAAPTAGRAAPSASSSGRSTTCRPAASRTRAGSRSPRTRSTDVGRAAPGRRGRARSASSTTATRSPCPASTAPRPRPRSAERRAMLEKARQAERLTAERDAAQERYERYRTGGHDPRRDRRARAHAPVADAAARAPRLGRAPARRRRQDRARSRACSRARSRSTSRSRPRSAGGRCRAGRSCSSLIGVAIAIVSFVAELRRGRRRRRRSRSSSAASWPAIGLVLAVVGWWLRRGDSRPTSRCATSRSTAGCAAARRSSRSCARRQAEHDDILQRLGLEPSSRRPRTRLRREEAHVAEIDQQRAHLSGLIGDETLEALPGRRDNAALEIEQKTAALEALGPIAKEPRARERLEVEVVDAERAGRPERATTRRTRGRASSRTRSTRRRSRRSPSASPMHSEELVRAAAPRAGLRADAAGAQHRRAGDDGARHALPRAAHGAPTSSGSPAAATGASGSTTANLGIEVYAPERDDWVPVTELSQGTLDVVYLAARIGLVRLVTGDRRPPILLDDPFVTLDDARAARALELLRDLVDGLPGHLPHDVGPLRRAGRAGHRARRSRPPSTCHRAGGGGPCLSVAGPVAVLALGLISAASWGAGDFGGGLLSRRAPLFGVVFGMQLIGMVAALAIGVARGEPFPQGADVGVGRRRRRVRRRRHHLALPRAGRRPDGRGRPDDRRPGGRRARSSSGSRWRASRRPRSSWASGSRCSRSCS